MANFPSISNITFLLLSLTFLLLSPTYMAADPNFVEKVCKDYDEKNKPRPNQCRQCLAKSSANNLNGAILTLAICADANAKDFQDKAAASKNTYCEMAMRFAKARIVGAIDVMRQKNDIDKAFVHLDSCLSHLADCQRDFPQQTIPEPMYSAYWKTRDLSRASYYTITMIYKS